MNVLKNLLWAVLGLLVVGGGFVLAARNGYLTPDEATLRSRYGLPNSRFADIEGQTIHYVDEGRGPAIVLVHGSYGSLRMWDSWAKELTGRYRVLRFDRPPMGLSSPQPGGGKDFVADEMRVIDELTRRLGIERFILVGTSSAGTPVAAYAVEHPERLVGLVLSNVAIGAVKPERKALPPALRFSLAIDPWFGGWHMSMRWREVLKMNFHDVTKVTPAMVREGTALNNRAQRLPRPNYVPSGAMFARTATDLPRIAVPTLLLWSGNDHEFPVDTVARRALEVLGTSDKHLEIIARCGHMLPLECGDEGVRVARASFDRWTTTNTVLSPMPAPQ